MYNVVLRQVENVPVNLAEETGPVADGRSHEAAMDIVEGDTVCPVILDIVYFELDVWRDAVQVSWSRVDHDKGVPRTVPAGSDSGRFL